MFEVSSSSLLIAQRIQKKFMPTATWINCLYIRIQISKIVVVRYFFRYINLFNMLMYVTFYQYWDWENIFWRHRITPLHQLSIIIIYNRERGSKKGFKILQFFQFLKYLIEYIHIYIFSKSYSEIFLFFLDEEKKKSATQRVHRKSSVLVCIILFQSHLIVYLIKVKVWILWTI